jgi:hypothetical protein
LSWQADSAIRSICQPLGLIRSFHFEGKLRLIQRLQ